MLYPNMIEAIGATPLVRLGKVGGSGATAYAKLELQNPFGMKDRVARQAILEARRRGELAEGAPIVESSSGTMALGVALVGLSLGHEVHIVTDPRIDQITLAKLRALGCAVHIVESMGSHGWQSARLQLVDRLMGRMPRAFCPRQYSNPDNPAAYRTLADELAGDLDHVDVLVGSVGSGGSLCGTARALRERFPDLRVVAVDCVGSVLFGQPDRPGRRQSGLGNSVVPPNLDHRQVDEVHWLNDREAFESAATLARDERIFAGNTSGSVYRVLRHVASHAPEGSRLVGILPDRGDRYVQTVYGERYWADQRLSELEAADLPDEVPYGTVVSSWSFSRTPWHPGGLA